MKYILPSAMLLFSLAVLATGGKPQSYGKVKETYVINAKKSMDLKSEE